MKSFPHVSSASLLPFMIPLDIVSLPVLRVLAACVTITREHGHSETAAAKGAQVTGQRERTHASDADGAGADRSPASGATIRRTTKKAGKALCLGVRAATVRRAAGAGRGATTRTMTRTRKRCQATPMPPFALTTTSVLRRQQRQ